MRARKYFLLTAGGSLVVMLGVFLWPAPNRPFDKYIGSPVPESVRVTLFESKDWLSANPEPVCYLAFTASAADLEVILQQGRFLATTNSNIPVPSGPPGWKTVDDLGAGVRRYQRTHRASGSGLPIGQNRTWHEYLWVDQTGTNAWFLLWGV